MPPVADHRTNWSLVKVLLHLSEAQIPEGLRSDPSEPSQHPNALQEPAGADISGPDTGVHGRGC